jgi:Holliday junction resolvase RusA-like endonuclease
MARRQKETRPEYAAEPGTTFVFHLDGNIPSKKNRVRFGKNGVFHDKKFSDWHKSAMAQMLPQRLNGWFSCTNLVRIVFTFESLRVKDLTNAAESIMDLLVDVGILSDDNFKVVPHLELKGVYTKGVSKTIVEIGI